MTDYTPTTEEVPDPLGDWFRRIRTALSDEDYETGIQVLTAQPAISAEQVANEAHSRAVGLLQQASPLQSYPWVANLVRDVVDETLRAAFQSIDRAGLMPGGPTTHI